MKIRFTTDMFLGVLTFALIIGVFGYTFVSDNPILERDYTTVWQKPPLPQASISAEASSDATSSGIKAIPQALSESEYQSQVRTLVRYYSPVTLQYHDALKTYTKVRDDLLALSVPAAFKDIHLDLVIHFESLVTALEKVVLDIHDQTALAELEQARRAMDDVLQYNSWLTQ